MDGFKRTTIGKLGLLLSLVPWAILGLLIILQPG